MDNFGEVIFYIVILIAILFNGLLSIVKKNNDKDGDILPPFNPQQKKQRSRKKLILAYPDQDETEMIPDKIPSLQEVDPVPMNATNKNIAPAIKRKTITTNNKKILEMVPLRSNKDLKRAVIYSEILNRKFF